MRSAAVSQSGFAAPLPSVHVHSWVSWQAVEPAWQDVFRESPQRSLFLSPDWVSAWLAAFGPQLNPVVLIFEDHGRPVGCCLLAERTVRKGAIPIRRVYLNTAGEDEADEACIEFNDLLVLDGWARPVARALRNYLLDKQWDEFVLDGCVSSPAVSALLEEFSALAIERRTVPSHYVPIAQLRGDGVPFEDTLSANTRYKLKRTRKGYQASGPLRLEAAQTAAEAQAMLDELAVLHQAQWQARNRPGVFASPLFRKFSSELVHRLHPRGGLQMLRLRAGSETIGVICGLVLDGKMSFYLSGFRYAEDNKVRPGLLTLAEAIEYCLAQGFEEFDLLAGAVQYKRSLAEQYRDLHWLVIQRPSARIRLLQMLRLLKRKGTFLTRKSSAPVPENT